MKPLDPQPRPDDPERDSVDKGDPMLAELRAAWRQENEKGELPPEALEATDPSTQAAVGWLQAAWAEEARREATGLPLSSVLTSRPSARLRPRPRLALLIGGGLAAAAALLLFIRVPPGQAPVDPATQVAGAEPPRTPTIFEADRFVSRSDGIEVITGSVRVVLVQPKR